MASRRHRRGHSKRNMLNKMVATSMTTMKTTSKKYMPVGSKVVSTGQKSVPFFKRMTQKLFSVFSSKSRRRRH